MAEFSEDPFAGVGSIGPNSSQGITNATLDMNSHSKDIGCAFQSFNKAFQAIGNAFQSMNPAAALQSLQSIPGAIVGGKIPGLFGGKGGK